MLKICFALFILSLSRALFCQVPDCQVPVIVLDSKSEPVSHLATSDLALSIDHYPIQIAEFTERAPQNVILVLDNSTEMSRIRSGWKNQILLLYWLASSAPNDVSLIVSSDTIDAVIEGREKVLAELKSRGERDPSFHGDSVLASTILKTIKAMKDHPGDVVLAIGPPHYGASGKIKKDIREALWARGVRLFYLETKFREAFWSLPAGFDLRPETVASGGAVASIGPSPESVRQALVDQMYRFHSVSFTLPPKAQSDGEMEVRYSGPLKSVTVAAPKRAVCGAVAK